MISWREGMDRIKQSDPAFTLPFVFGLGFAAVVIVGLALAGLRAV
jgi:hypothetical protein